MNHFCKTPLWECTRTLSAVAMGRLPAETVIRDGNLVNVCTHEILPHTDVAIHSGRIALVGDASGCIGPETRVVDAGGKYLLPGLLDGHIHVESSMLSVGEYARTVIPHGTVGIYYDPHEICNVLGLDGVALMERDAARTPLKAMLTVPSCVPAMPGFEDSGAVVTARDIARQMQRETVVGLGEMMNFPGILQGEAEPHAIVAETLKAGKTVTGHYAAPETGQGLNAYIAAGACCCHESTRAEDALAKMRLGMYAMLREGSAWRDLHEVGRAILEQTVDTRFAVLVSDDAHPATLLRQGHMDHILRRAVEEGIDPITAVQMADHQLRPVLWHGARAWLHHPRQVRRRDSGGGSDPIPGHPCLPGWRAGGPGWPDVPGICALPLSGTCAAHHACGRDHHPGDLPDSH